MSWPPDPEHVALGPGVVDEYGYGICVCCGCQGELHDGTGHPELLGQCVVCQPCPECGGHDCDYGALCSVTGRPNA